MRYIFPHHLKYVLKNNSNKNILSTAYPILTVFGIQKSASKEFMENIFEFNTLIVKIFEKIIIVKLVMKYLSNA